MNELIAGLLFGIILGMILGWRINRIVNGVYISLARVALIESVLTRIKERAERVLEGEKWDLASYVVKTIAELGPGHEPS